MSAPTKDKIFLFLVALDALGTLLLALGIITLMDLTLPFALPPLPSPWLLIAIGLPLTTALPVLLVRRARQGRRPQP